MFLQDTADAIYYVLWACINSVLVFFAEYLVEKRLESMQPPVAMEANRVLSNPTEDVLSDGERMTAELKDIIVQFMQKVWQV